MTPSFKALLIDLDGTLVDSSAVVCRIMEGWCLKHNIPLQSVLDVCHGGRTEDTVALIAPHLCAKSEAAEIEALESTSLDGLMPIEGAGKFLAALDPEQWAVVTSSSLLTARPKLNACRLPIPRVLITAESVANGKPHPDPFLKAAEALGMKPEDCLVFEDANNGIQSALAAGCTVVVVGNDCRIEHAKIVCRIATFAEIQLTEDGNLLVGDKTVATFTRA